MLNMNNINHTFFLISVNRYAKINYVWIHESKN